MLLQPNVRGVPLIILLLVVHVSCTSSADQSRYKTGYACEGRELAISCGEGSSIQLTRANYGRYSISICNDHGNLDWKVDCTAPKSYFVISNRCNNRERCSVTASSELFTDPCPGTRKYLEVQYQCLSSGSANNSSAGAGDGDQIQRRPPSLPFHPLLNVNNTYNLHNLRPPIISPPSVASAPTAPSARPTIIIPLTPLRKGTATSTTSTTAAAPAAGTGLLLQGIPASAAASSPSSSSPPSGHVVQPTIGTSPVSPFRASVPVADADSAASNGHAPRRDSNSNDGHKEEVLSSTRDHHDHHDEGKSLPASSSKPFSSHAVITSTFSPQQRIPNRIIQKEGELFWLTTPTWLSDKHNSRNSQNGEPSSGTRDAASGMIDSPPIEGPAFPGFSANDVRDPVNSVTTRKHNMNDNHGPGGGGDQADHKTSQTSSSQSTTLSLITILTFATAFISVILIVLCLNGNYKLRRHHHHQPQPHAHHHLSRSASSSFNVSKVSSLFLPDCLMRVIGSSPSKSASSTLASHHPLHLHHHPQFHSSNAAITSTYNSSSSTPSQSAPAYFCPLDPNHLVPSPPSPLIRTSIHSHHHHVAHPVKDMVSSGSSNSSAGSTSTSVTVGGVSGILQPSNNMNNMMMAKSSNLLHAQNNRRNSSFIQDVSPYADPVSVTGHEYEDIGTVMRDVAPYSMTLQLNTSSHQKSHNVNHRTLNPRTAPTQHHQQQLQQQVQQQQQHQQHHQLQLQSQNNCNNHFRHHDRSPEEETLYYERSNPREVSNIAGPDTTVITPSSSVIYGSRNNGLSLGSNYVFHNTRSPIYYTDSRR